MPAKASASHVRAHATAGAPGSRITSLTIALAQNGKSFPLFGLDLSDYETLFEEKLGLLAAVVAEQPVSWQGSIRPPRTRR